MMRCKLMYLMQVMCALVANDPAKQNWLRSAGLLQVLHRLTLGAQGQGKDDVSDDVSSALGEHVSLSVRRQCARILAVLAQQQDALVCSNGRAKTWHCACARDFHVAFMSLLPSLTRHLPDCITLAGQSLIYAELKGSA